MPPNAPPPASAPTEPLELRLFAESFCPSLVLEDDEVMELYAEQRLMLVEFFDGVRETLILQPKKNGKTSLLAALGLYHLTTRADAACFIGASSRDQATILYEQAKNIVSRSAWLEDEVVVKGGYREIRSRRDAGRLRVLAADADTADGVLPTLALVDELHRHKSPALYGIFRDGLGPRNGQMVTISTAGEDEESALGQLRSTAYALPGLERQGAYRRVHSSGFALHEWALDGDEDRTDLEVVKAANPAPWQTIDELRIRRESPSMTPNQWARFACGVWVADADYVFDRNTYAALEVKSAEDAAELGLGWDEVEGHAFIPPGRFVTLGFDGARRFDSTGLIATDVASGFQEVAGFWPRPPEAGDDWETPEDEVDEVVDYAFGRWEVWRLYADPPYWESAVDRWAGKHGKEKVVRWWTLRLKQMAFAVRAFKNDMKPGKMHHAGELALVDHVANCVRRSTRMRDGDDELYVVRKASPKSPDKIDLGTSAILSWQARGDAIRDGAQGRGSYSRASW